MSRVAMVTTQFNRTMIRETAGCCHTSRKVIDHWTNHRAQQLPIDISNELYIKTKFNVLILIAMVSG